MPKRRASQRQNEPAPTNHRGRIFYIPNRFWPLPTHLDGGEHPGAWVGENAANCLVALVNGSHTFPFPGEREFAVFLPDGRITRFSTVPKMYSWLDCRDEMDTDRWRALARLTQVQLEELRAEIEAQTRTRFDD